MKKFVSLRVDALKLDNLAGLCDETIAVAVPKSPSLGTLGNARMNSLDADNKTLKALLNRQRASALTPEINKLDKQRDADLNEIKRTAAKSSTPATAAAGHLTLTLGHPKLFSKNFHRRVGR